MNLWIWQYDELRIFLKELLLTLLHLMRNILLIILILSAKIVSGQQFSIYQGITTSNGLPSNYVFSICEDEKGYLWVGTDKGLCRFNGFSWQIWDKDNGLPGNYVSAVFPDKKGGLWLSISQKGLYHFDMSNGVSTKVTDQKDISFNSINPDASGNVLLERVEKKTVCGYLLQANNFAHPSKVYEYYPKSGYTIRANPTDKKVFLLTSGTQKSLVKIKTSWTVVYKSLPPSKVAQGIYYASDRLVISNTKSYHFNKSGKVERVLNLFNDHNTYAVNCITNNGYYISNILSGYYFVNAKGDAHFYTGKSGLGSDYINQVYEMRDGTIVFATLGAGIQFKRNEYKRTYLTGNRIVHSIFKEGSNWYTLAGENVLKISEVDSQLNDLGKVQTSALTMYKKQDHLVVGSLKGINFYDLNNGLKPQQFIPYNSGISSVIQNGTGFYASTYGNGFISFTNTADRPVVVSIIMPIIEKTVPLRQGFALLSYEDGIIITDTINSKNLHLTLKDGLLSNSINYIHEYLGSYYIGSKGGLSIYANGKVQKTISYNEGFVGKRVVYSFHDKNHTLWVISDKYLHVFDGVKLRVISSHPIVTDAEDNINAAFYDAATNQLATGSSKNISLISLAGIQPNKNVLVPNILQTLIDGKDQEGNNYSVPYYFNTIAFNIAPFATSPLSKNKFLYMLKGKDKAWREVEDSLTITYNALRPGSYQLMAKIINPDGYESTDTLVAAFKVDKPFWQTGPSFALVMLVTSLITLLLARSVEAYRQRKREDALIMEHSLRTERERISKDLHDHLGSNLVNIVAQVDNIENRMNRRSFPEALTSIQKLSMHAREVINVLRETVWAVQENEHTMDSFIIRIRTFLQRMYEFTPINWHVNITAGAYPNLSSKQTLHLFRIIQEATQNILKHSKAKTADYDFVLHNSNIEVTIRDTGTGFTANSKTGQGMANMKQRAKDMNATISIDSQNGTAIKLVVPVNLVPVV